MKVVITGGGTAGHVFPAVHVATKLKEQAGAELHFFGNRQHVEAEIARAHGIPFYAIPSRGLEGKNAFDKYAGFVFHNAKGVFRALRYLKEIKPDFVFATGGFVSAPVLAASQMLGIPYSLHEQNSVLGKVNRLFGEHANAVFHSFPIEAEGNRLYSGNPVRFTEPLETNGSKVVFIGGSGGSQRLNDAALLFAKNNPHIGCLLVSGKALYEDVQVQAQSRKLGNLEILPYADDMLAVYQQAAIAVCRSGAGTVFELANLSIPSILVPLPTSADDHQKKNAAFFQTQAAALLIEEGHQFDEELEGAILALWADADKRKTLKANIERLAVRNSAAVIAEELLRATAEQTETLELAEQPAQSFEKGNE